MDLQIEKIRSELPVTKQYIYLDHASVGPLPKRVVDVTVKINAEKYYGGLHWPNWESLVEDTRKTIARFINAKPEETALVPNTSEGISIVANGIKWKNGDNIVTTNLEFPSNLIPWQVQARKHSIQLKVVSDQLGKLRMEDFVEMIDEKTRIVAVSHIQFSNGFKTDLKELAKIAHEHNALVVTDAVQSVGQIPVDVKKLDVDFLATSGYKWLLSPIATGFLYMKQELMEDVELSIVGYRSAENMEKYAFREFKPADTARRFEHGQLNFPGFAGMREAILLLDEVNIDRIEKRIADRTDQILDRVQKWKEVQVDSSMEAEHRSGIVKLKCKKPETVQAKLFKKNIITSVRENGLRVSPHFYNTSEEIERFLTYLQQSI